MVARHSSIETKSCSTEARSTCYRRMVMELPVNHFKRAIAAVPPQIVLWCSFPTHHPVEVLCQSGFAWLLLDMEHSPNDMGTLHPQLMATAGGTATPIVRPPWNDMVL